MNTVRAIALCSAVMVLPAVLVACGGSSNTGGASGGGTSAASDQQGGTIKLLMGTAPDYLDPQEGYTTQSAEATWLSYTGLYTYAHKSGTAGGQVIPGLAQAVPVVSNGGKTYKLKLRQGLTYSDGSPVKASDFAYTIERAEKLNWGGKSFYTGYIKGALAYDTGKAKSISGIKADDATGSITINLTKP